MILKNYFEEDLKDLDKILDNISKQYAAAYGESKQGADFKKGKEKDLRYRMGNAVLSECRKIERNARMQKNGRQRGRPLLKTGALYRNKYVVSRALNSLRKIAYKNIQSMKNQAAYERSFMEDLGREF